MKGLGLKKLGASIAATLGRQLGAGLLQLATMAIIARVYGPEGNGAYTVALLLPLMLASMLNLGISPANVYFLGAGKISSQTAWRNTLFLYGGIAITGSAVGAVVLIFFSERWFPGVHPRLLWFALLIFPFSLLLNFVSSFYQGLQQFKQFNIVLLLQPSITLGGVLLLSVSGVESIGWLLSAYLAGTCITLITAIKLLTPLLSAGTDHQENYAKASLTYGIKAHLSNVITFINYKSDIFLVNLFVGPAGAGIYVIAVQFAERLWMLSTAVSTVLLPRLSQLSNDEEKRRELTPLICRWVLTLTLIGSLALLVIAKPLIALVFGPDFTDASKVLAFLIPGIVLWAGGRVLSNDIAARGKPEINFYISTTVLFTNVFANVILIPLYGITGAAIATSMAYCFDFTAKIFIYKKITECKISYITMIGNSDVAKIKSIIGKHNLLSLFKL